MNISPETSKKILKLLNHPDAINLKNTMGSIDQNKLLELFKQINPTQADIKMAEEKIKGMTNEEIIGEVMKKMKG